MLDSWMGRGQKGSDGHDKVGLGTVRRPVIGLALGVLCGFATHVRVGSDGIALARVGWLFEARRRAPDGAPSSDRRSSESCR